MDPCHVLQLGTVSLDNLAPFPRMDQILISFDLMSDSEIGSELCWIFKE